MPGFVKTPEDEAKWDKAKEAAGKTKGGKTRWALANYIYHKCEVSPELVKAEHYTPLVFRTAGKKSDEQGEKLDFPSAATDPFRLRDTKQQDFPSTPGTGEAYAQAFQTVGNQAPQGVPSYHPGNFKGEHGPDTQYKGTDHVPAKVRKRLAKKSLIIAGRKVVVKSEKPIGEYTKKYPGATVTFNQPIDPNKKASKVFVHLTEEGRDVKAKRADKSIKNLVLQYTQNQPLAPCFKPLVAILTGTNDENEEDNSLKVTTFNKKHVGKAMSGEPSADRPPRRPMTTEEVHEKIRRTTRKPEGPNLRAGESDTSDVNAHDDAGEIHPGFDKWARGFNKKSMKISKGAFKDLWIKQQEAKGKDPLEVPGRSKIDTRIRDAARNREIDETMARARKAALDNDPDPSAKKSSQLLSLQKDIKDAKNINEIRVELDKKVEKPVEITKKYPTTNPIKNRDAYLPGGAEITRSKRPNPIDGGEGDDLDYKDVDQKELESGIDVEMEHVGKHKEMDEDEKKVAAADIAMDHLAELPDYYKRLDEMERQGKENLKQESKKKKLLRATNKSKAFYKSYQSWKEWKKRKND